MNRRILIVVPCYNEAERLARHEFLDFLKAAGHVSFLFVDDGSSDGTGKILEGLAAAQPGRIFFLGLSNNVGKAEAVRQGFLKAFGMGADLVGYFDADLAAPLSTILELDAFFDHPSCEIAMGSRVRLLGRSVERSGMRHYLGRFFATAASFVLRLPVYDTQCGAKLFRRTGALEEVFSSPFRARWVFDVEILARFRMIRETGGGSPPLAEVCVEHPLSRWADKQGSKLRFGDFLTAGADLLKIFLALRCARKKGG